MLHGDDIEFGKTTVALGLLSSEQLARYVRQYEKECGKGELSSLAEWLRAKRYLQPDQIAMVNHQSSGEENLVNTQIMYDEEHGRDGGYPHIQEDTERSQPLWHAVDDIPTVASDEETGHKLEVLKIDKTEAAPTIPPETAEKTARHPNPPIPPSVAKRQYLPVGKFKTVVIGTGIFVLTGMSILLWPSHAKPPVKSTPISAVVAPPQTQPTYKPTPTAAVVTPPQTEPTHYGLPSELWQACAYRAKQQEVLDMTASAWLSLPPSKQEHYARAYQKEFARSQQQAVEKIVQVGGIPVTLVLIPPGRFFMGSPDDEPGRSKNEKRHVVFISKAFWCSKTEVIQRQWQAVMGGRNQAVPDTPLESVDWHACVSFCHKTGMRMPTESEWEYVCRAGSTGMTYPGFAAKQTAGQKLPNPWGVYDMLGNVSEWCSDWYGAYPTVEKRNPTGPSVGTHRVVRGGGRKGTSSQMRSAFRYFSQPQAREKWLGLRLCSDM